MDALPPDPYAALGVAKDATTAHIKQQYRKLVLKLHPDKVQDDGLKQAAADQFHKVQSAYEIVSDEDRRQRYDAQCKLEQLRRDAMERGGGGRMGPDVRMSGYRMPPESARGGDFYPRGPERSGRMSPQFEERAPRYDYFDGPPRPTSRKDNDFERSSKRAPPREDPKKSKTSSKKSKENERSAREERSRRSDQDVRKERERKSTFAFQQSPTSDSDEYDRARRQRDEDDLRKQRAMEDEVRRRREEEATASVFGEERARKYFDQEHQARAYQAGNSTSPQERSPPRERRPSPVRMSSSRENVEYVKRKDGKPPVMIRRGSGRPELSREPRKSSSREKSFDIVDEPEEISPSSRRPPTLNKTNSSPADIRPPLERQRSSSVQFDSREPPMIPSMKRAETMPYPQTSSRKDPSKLRTQVPQDAYPTPETSPEPPTPRRGSSGRNLADEDDYRRSESYRTEVREPASPRDRGFERSPPPMEDYSERREKSRSSSSKYAPPPQMKRTTSTQYAYPSPTDTADAAARRPSLPRENSSKLFGEVNRDFTSEPTIRSPKPSSRSRYPLPDDNVQYSPKIKPEDVKMAAGNYVRRGAERSSRTPVYAR